jgi:hypothetical protein
MMIVVWYVIINISFGAGLLFAGKKWSEAGPIAAAWPWYLITWIGRNLERAFEKTMRH